MKRLVRHFPRIAPLGLILSLFLILFLVFSYKERLRDVFGVNPKPEAVRVFTKADMYAESLCDELSIEVRAIHCQATLILDSPLHAAPNKKLEYAITFDANLDGNGVAPHDGILILVLDPSGEVLAQTPIPID